MIKKLTNSIFKILLLAVSLGFHLHAGYAQTGTAGILPNAKTTYVDANGNPLSSGKVYFYSPGTTTAKTTWQDINKTTPNTNPVNLDAAGRALIWGDGTYRQIVYDRNNNLQWDQTTSVIGGSASGTSSGDGNAVGTVLAWSGFIAPPQYMFAYGQTVSRSTYSQLLANLTQKYGVTCAGGSNVIGGFTDTTQIPIGAAVEASCLLSTGIVTAKGTNTVTLNITANIGIATTATVYPYGNGDGLTTFNLPDYRGYALVGRCNMGGVNCSVLTSTYYSSDPNALNAVGGSQSHTLTLAELPTGITSTGVNAISVLPGGGGTGVPLTSTPTNIVTANVVTGAGSVVPASTSGSWGGTSTFSGNNTINVTSNNTNGSAHSIIQPSKTVNYIIKVSPDLSISGLFGVSDIAGMQGSIACGAGLTCAGGTINTIPGSTTGIIGFTGNNGVTLTGQCSTNLTGSCVVTAGPGVDKNCLLAKTANYSIAPGDEGCTISATGGPFTITLPAVAGFASNAVVSVCNSNANDISHHAIRLSGFPDPVFIRLYMGQCVGVAIENGVWVAKSVPGRFRPAFTPKLYIDNAGSDSNDGLVSNAAANSLATVQGCLSIFANEYDLRNIQPSCFPTGGSSFTGSFNQIGMSSGSSVIWVESSSPTTLRVTPGSNVVATISDFGGYIIFRNVQLDCTGGATPCYGLFMHQQGGVDFFAGTSFSGHSTSDYAVFCDSFCKVNMNGDASSGFTLTGTMGDAFFGVMSSMFSFSNGLTFSAGTTVAGNVFNMSQNSSLSFSGPFIINAVTAVGTFFNIHANSTACVSSNFTVAGAPAAGAKKFAAYNGGLLQNGSAIVIPGTVAGTVTGTGVSPGFAPDNGGTNTGVNGGGC